MTTNPKPAGKRKKATKLTPKSIKSTYRSRLDRMDSIERLSPEDYEKRANSKAAGGVVKKAPKPAPAKPRPAKAKSAAELREEATVALRAYNAKWATVDHERTLLLGRAIHASEAAREAEVVERCAKIVEDAAYCGTHCAQSLVHRESVAATIRAGGSR